MLPVSNDPVTVISSEIVSFAVVVNESVEGVALIEGISSAVPCI